MLAYRAMETHGEAWDGFTRKYSGLIFISIKNRLKKYGLDIPHQEIEDIRQNILASLWKDGKLDDIRNASSLPYWLSIVSGNAAVAYIRKKDRFESLKSVSLSDAECEGKLADILASDAAGPYKEAERREISLNIEKAMDALPERERLIIKLRLIHDKKYDDIARMLNLPKSTVASLIKRAKEKLRKKLKYFE